MADVGKRVLCVRALAQTGILAQVPTYVGRAVLYSLHFRTRYACVSNDRVRVCFMCDQALKTPAAYRPDW